jgi:hypothetical protein
VVSYIRVGMTAARVLISGRSANDERWESTLAVQAQQRADGFFFHDCFVGEVVK